MNEAYPLKADEGRPGVNEQTDPRAGRSVRNRSLRNHQRERVLQLVREHDGPIDALELAALTGLHVTTVRFHVDALCDERLVVRTRMNRAGAGRPRTGYQAVRERLDYQVLAEVLAMELGSDDDVRARRAQRAGRKWAVRLAPDAEADASLDHAARRVVDTFNPMGFAPELTDTADRERLIRLHECPIRTLARAYPEVACRLHLGLLQGLVGQTSGEASDAAVSAHLEPFVESELCLARIVAK